MSKSGKFSKLIKSFNLQRGLIWGLLIVAALLAFEIFNYSTTDFAMSDLLGDLSFAGTRWATILAIAFCGIDFAGIARLFTPEQGADEPKEVWYLFGAWLLAATMNAMLTWWGVSIAIIQTGSLGNEVVARETLINVVPIFVAIMVWLIRVLIIGTLSVAGENLFTMGAVQPLKNTASSRPRTSSRARTNRGNYVPATRRSSATSFKPSPKSIQRPEPTYHPVSMQSKSNQSTNVRS
jgi:hypothetical protein